VRKEDRGNRRATEAEVLTFQEISKRKVRLKFNRNGCERSSRSQAQAKSGVLAEGCPCPYRESAGLGADLINRELYTSAKKEPGGG
jgi:hypothetical protein